MIASSTTFPFIYLFISSLLLSLTYTLPSNPLPALSLPSFTTSNHSLSIPNITEPIDPVRTLDCFDRGEPKTSSVTVEDCSDVIELIIHDPAGALELTIFSRDPDDHEDDVYKVPKEWEFGGCMIILSAEGKTAIDSFRLVDVIVKANEILAECPGKSKEGLGGVGFVGNRQGFFVAVNGADYGPPVDPDGIHGLGGKANGTIESAKW